MGLKNTQTEKNILSAFSGESQARNKYLCFAEVARKEGHSHTAELFEKMAQNEMHHAFVWLKSLEDSIGNTAENIISSINTENYESTDMYIGFAKTARKEGFSDIADMFERVAAIERDHENMFKKELVSITGKAISESQPKVLENESVKTISAEKLSKKQQWRCPICGYVEESDEPPYLCSVCGALGVWDKL